MSEVLIKNKDGSWSLWKDGKLVKTTPPQTNELSSQKSLTEEKRSDIDNSIIAIVTAAPAAKLEGVWRERLVDAIRLALKGVRDRVATREILMRSREERGFGFSETEADKILFQIKEESEKIHKAPAKETSPINASLPVVAPQPIISEAAPIQTKQDIQKITAKPSMVDVRPISTPKASGPLDEFKIMTLEDWRRLSLDPKVAAARLKDKLNMYEEESYDMYAEALKAWRLSPLYKLYLSYGAEAIDKGVALSEIIVEHKSTDPASLTKEEFDEILKLNREVRI